MNEVYRPLRQGINYPAPSLVQWRRLLRKCKHVETGHKSACWIWCGRVDSEGYGEAKYNGAKRFTHRIGYARKHGNAPARRHIDHLCSQRACMNPAHLQALQPSEHNEKSGNSDSSPVQVNRQNIFDYVGSGDILPI